jgi:hypothetical protein
MQATQDEIEAYDRWAGEIAARLDANTLAIAEAEVVRRLKELPGVRCAIHRQDE